MGKSLPREEVMPERRTVLSKDKIEFLETWKEEKRDHVQKIFQHLDEEKRLRNHSHSIDSHTHDILFTGLTLLPLEVAKRSSVSASSLPAIYLTISLDTFLISLISVGTI
jgi:hypothetical protein